MSEPTVIARPGRKATMRRRTRWLALTAVLAAASAALLQGYAQALPAGAAKLGMVCTVPATPATFNLTANTGYIETPDGNSVFMWSYANADAPDNNHFQSPGPVLCVNQGQTVTVHLHNTLPEATSVVFPGQEGVASSGGSAGLLAREAPAGGDVTYSFTASAPGTYLYESGSDVAKQVEMGLVGALVVRPNATNCPVVAGTDCAYGPATRFDAKREFLLLLNEIDPDLHHAVEVGGTAAYDVNALHNRYFAINGREFPDTIQDNGTALLPNQPYGALVRLQPNTATSTQPALLRMLNAGALNHPFHPHGNHTRQVGQDGRPVAPTEHFGETIGSGQTLDYLLRWDDQDNWNPNSNQLPVAQPNYRNLVFKDGNTFYSGSPYLGYKGTLPTGTVSQNVCGEWYFPLHSHALNEFTNFDQGFGGMGTLLRVDPPGGCFAFPTSTKITAGTLNSGTVTNLAVNDANYYRVSSTTTGTRTTDWYGQLSGIPAGAANLKVTYKGNNTPAPARSQTLHIWNWTTSAWVQIAGPTSVGTVDVTVGPVAVPAAPAAGSWASYVGTGANKGLVRVRVLTTGGTTNFVTGGNLMTLVYDAP
jgi:FtsP/CotA-like multicopper oxidase with cupredoxin domain